MSALAAWLTAASIVNVSATLVYYGVGGNFAYPNVTAITIGVGGAIAALATLRSRGNPWYALVFCWALLAIYFRGGQQAQSIAYTCAFAGVGVLLAMASGLVKRSNRRHWLGW